MVSTSKINNKKADAKHPHIHTVFPQDSGEKWNINRFTHLLTVRRMFSLLYYLGILAYPMGNVKHNFSLFQGKFAVESKWGRSGNPGAAKGYFRLSSSASSWCRYSIS